MLGSMAAPRSVEKRTRLDPAARRAQLIELGVEMLATRTLDELSVEDIASEGRDLARAALPLLLVQAGVPSRGGPRRRRRTHRAHRAGHHAAAARRAARRAGRVHRLRRGEPGQLQVARPRCGQRRLGHAGHLRRDPLDDGRTDRRGALRPGPAARAARRTGRARLGRLHRGVRDPVHRRRGARARGTARPAHQGAAGTRPRLERRRGQLAGLDPDHRTRPSLPNKPGSSGRSEN